MAQKKLLFVLMIMVLKLDLPAFAVPKLEFSEDDKKWAKELSDSSMNMTLESIKAKYTELMRMLDNESEDINQTLAEYDIFAARPVLKIFVSSSMSKSLLTAYASEAKKYDAVLIFNGLPGGSWQELSKLVAAMNEATMNEVNSEVAMQIDDQAFEEYGITSVPAIVLAKEEQCLNKQTCRHVFDKVVGNLDIRAALEMFSEGGDLADDARGMLDSR